VPSRGSKISGFFSLGRRLYAACQLRKWIERLGVYGGYLKDVLAHDTDGPYWWKTDIGRHLSDIDTPMLHVGSWYDIANCDTPKIFSQLSGSARSEAARTRQALLMGPWAHLLPYNQPTRGGAGDIDFGPDGGNFLAQNSTRLVRPFS